MKIRMDVIDLLQFLAPVLVFMYLIDKEVISPIFHQLISKIDKCVRVKIYDVG